MNFYSWAVWWGRPELVICLPQDYQVCLYIWASKAMIFKHPLVLYPQVPQCTKARGPQAHESALEKPELLNTQAFFFNGKNPLKNAGWSQCCLLTWWSWASVWSQPSPKSPQILCTVSQSIGSILMLIENPFSLGPDSWAMFLSQQNPF